jgi:DNA-binding transcriptional LysR family regulator
MNIEQLKAILEVAACGSISRAAERLYMNQSNLSRLVMNLEDEFGLTIFQRTAAGVTPTQEGAEFLKKASVLAASADEFERSFKAQDADKLVFRISLPRVSYLTYAFSRTVAEMQGARRLRICYRETNNQETIDSVASQGYDMGVIRFPIEFESDYKKLLVDRQIQFQEILTFRFVVVMSAEHPLAGRREVSLADLRPYAALVHGDNRSPMFTDRETDRYYRTDAFESSINLFERGSQFDFLQNIPGTFMLVSPLPRRVLERGGLVQARLSAEDMGLFEDLLISRRSRRYSDFEQEFLHQLLDVEREIMEWDAQG